MTTQVRCPFCSSEKVYLLLNTLHCKRCKNMWKGDSKNPDNSVSGRFAEPVSNRALRITKKTDTLESRMEKRLEEYLKRSHGKFSMDTITWNAGDITEEMFRRYLKTCVNKKALAEKKTGTEGYGIRAPIQVRRMISLDAFTMNARPVILKPGESSPNSRSRNSAMKMTVVLLIFSPHPNPLISHYMPN
jgi:ribosomal protein L37AE/L43A